MDDLKIYVLSFTVENKIDNLHKIRLFTFISNLTYNEWYTPHTSNLRICQRIGKICFSLGKIEFWTHWEFCAYHRIFGIRKGHDYLYQLFNVLPKQTTFEMKARQVAIQVYIQQGFHDVEDFMF